MTVSVIRDRVGLVLLVMGVLLAVFMAVTTPLSVIPLSSAAMLSITGRGNAVAGALKIGFGVAIVAFGIIAWPIAGPTLIVTALIKGAAVAGVVGGGMLALEGVCEFTCR